MTKTKKRIAFLLLILVVLGVIFWITVPPPPTKEDIVTTEESGQQKEEVPELTSAYPEWLTALLPEELEIAGRPFTQHIDTFKHINDSVSYCISMRSDRVCFWKQMTTFMHENPIDTLELAVECDADLSQAEHTWKTFAQGPIDNFTITTFVARMPDSLLNDDGYVRDGYELMGDGSITNSTTLNYTINEQGQID